MASYTPNYNLKKPTGSTDHVSVSDINGNMDIIDTQLKATNDQIVPSYEVLETGLTIVRMGRLRILSLHGMADFETGSQGTYTLPAGDAPHQHITASCWVADSSYYKIRIGRIYVEDGKLYARQVSDYNTANKGMAKLLTGDRVYGEIVYTT